jgi:hypothetical protein
MQVIEFRKAILNEHLIEDTVERFPTEVNTGVQSTTLAIYLMDE